MSEQKDKPKNVREIIASWLAEHGYEGLYDEDGECACELADLGLCDGFPEYCKPGYKHPGNNEYDFMIMADKEEIEELEK